MANKFLLYVVVVLGFVVVSCMGTMYIVGDTSGWDISSPLDLWSTGKTFKVGDTLTFQYSSTHSVSELTKDNFNACNVTKPIQSYRDGNTTISLSRPGERYFACGNALHCLGGMKLQVNVNGNDGDSTATGPAPPEVGSPLPTPSTKKTDSLTTPTSDGFVHGGTNSLVLTCVTTILVTLLLSFVS